MEKIILIVSIILCVSVINTEVRGSYSAEEAYEDTISSKAFFSERVGELFTVDIKDVDLGKVLTRISNENGVKFSLPLSLAEEKVMVRFSGLRLDEGLAKILQRYNRIFIYQGEPDLPFKPSLSRLKEVRIYPPSYKGRQKEPLMTIVQGSEYMQKEKPDGKDVAEEKREEKSARTGGGAVEDFFLDLKDEDIGVRLEAVKALAKIDDERVIKPLSLALNDKDIRVTREAERALQEMGESLKERNKEREELEKELQGDDPNEGDEEREDSADEGEEGKKSTLSLDSGTGSAPSVALYNEVPVRGVQFTLKGAKPTDIRTTSRTEGFFAQCNEKNGKVIMTSLSGATIKPGDGPIAEVVCSNGGSASLSDIKIVE